MAASPDFKNLGPSSSFFPERRSIFSFHITVYLKDVKVSLYKKDKAVLFTYDQYQDKNVDQASGSVLLYLEKGDQVWLQAYGDEENNGVYADNVNDSIFTGFLLYHNIE